MTTRTSTDASNGSHERAQGVVPGVAPLLSRRVCPSLCRLSSGSIRLVGFAVACCAGLLPACDVSDMPPSAASHRPTTRTSSMPAATMAFSDPRPEQSAGPDTPLTWAAAAGRVDLIEKLLEEGTPVDQREQTSGRTPLHWAAFHGQQEALRLLLARGAAIEAHDSAYRRTALLWAAAGGHGEAVQFLADRGADVNATDRAGHKPVDLARNAHNTEVFQILISRSPQ
ncbi:MAG: ankyrin repeat domain-containing protein [Phycisphaerae bacterium]|nr:ankyrin repeat domain-containing protein [Phycisphaerae bacterium]